MLLSGNHVSKYESNRIRVLGACHGNTIFLFAIHTHYTLVVKNSDPQITYSWVHLVNE